MTLQDDARLRIAPNVFAREFDGETVVLDLGKGEYFGLNASGGVAWLALSSGKSLGEAADAILARYEVTAERARDDVRALARELVERGLATVEGASP
jgi:hypothetical protein